MTAIVEYMGGGFGSKFGIELPGQIACQLSKKAKAPVKLMLNRARRSSSRPATATAPCRR